MFGPSGNPLITYSKLFYIIIKFSSLQIVTFNYSVWHFRTPIGNKIQLSIINKYLPLFYFFQLGITKIRFSYISIRYFHSYQYSLGTLSTVMEMAYWVYEVNSWLYLIWKWQHHKNATAHHPCKNRPQINQLKQKWMKIQ